MAVLESIRGTWTEAGFEGVTGVVPAPAPRDRSSILPPAMPRTAPPVGYIVGEPDGESEDLGDLEDAEDRRPTIPMPGLDSGVVSRRGPADVDHVDDLGDVYDLNIPDHSEVGEDAVIELPHSRRPPPLSDTDQIVGLPEDEIIGLPAPVDPAPVGEIDDDAILGLPQDTVEGYQEIPPPPPDEDWVEQSFDDEDLDEDALGDTVIYPARD